ncbi:MAG TPA: TetR/AcrR family transcriptional regulator [Pyrinomonadaceae bacterium]|nr:TetR/AcrR family transcriptional regulator [Pyrinomonadaceae bacterium]
MKPKKKTSDRRTRRTRNKVSGALVDLIKEKRFDDITVQNLIDRAGVGRSTFYSHFRDKEDAFEHQWEAFSQHLANQIKWDQAGRDSFFPVAPLFRHLQEEQSFYRGLVRSGKIDALLKRGVDYLTGNIETALNQILESREITVPIPVLSHYLANECFGLLKWWLDAGMPYTPAAMDQMFHRLVNPTIKSALLIR